MSKTGDAMKLISLMRKFIQLKSKIAGPVLNFCLSVLSILFLVQCQSLELGSNSQLSSEEAESRLTLRLKKTAEVKKKIDSVRNALAPLELIMGDLSNALDVKFFVNEKPSRLFLKMIQRLREILKESSQSLVQYRSDGSWILERNVALPLDRLNYSCKTSQIQILGQKNQDHEVLTLTLKDCFSPSSIQLAFFSIYSDHIEAHFFPEKLESLAFTTFEACKCSLRLEGKDLDVHCDPIEIKSDSLSLVLSTLDFKNSESGISASIRISISDSSSRLLAELELEAHPGKNSQIHIKTSE